MKEWENKLIKWVKYYNGILTKKGEGYEIRKVMDSERYMYANSSTTQKQVKTYLLGSASNTEDEIWNNIKLKE